ncbi:hypothetical protein GCM10011492_38090 [Flexivirga endophytica]|uniref:TadE-like domain-containing protein n=1 Tax=Flexivirga endophytica TaxID=1849103 RepID=A0A916TGC7_9MICO|nr:TadE/TadG family type IV pilus assembly protein [Flexivirga endophytica]GGB43479.1 hypothetical protein GCM10011492_38090 [Flexivirga endophytica]GHB68372.1 hypothetical protein GCM10008112_41420 [Flexivirga endophytica]
MHAAKRPTRREHGASAVEFALVLPLLVLLIGGMVDFGRAFYTEVTLTNAAREGARSAMYGNAPGDRASQAAETVPGATVSTDTCAKGVNTGDVSVTVQAPFQWVILGPAMNLITLGSGSALPTTLTGKATMQCGG